MDRGGSFTEGGLPDDMGDELDEGDGLPLRGWVPPDDRLYLHPSEIAKTPRPPVDVTRTGTSAPPSRRRPQTTALTATALAVVVVLLVLAVDRLPGDGAGGTVQTDGTSLTTAVLTAPAVAAASNRLARSLVGLVVDRPAGRAVATGTVMAPGDLVVTAASAVAGATGVTVVSASGRRLAARVMGVDPTTGVAVVHLRGRLAPARFADDVAVGELAMTDCVCDRATVAGHPAATVSVARVDAIGVRPGGRSDVLDGIEADGVRSSAWGAVLADSAGRVAGVLDTRTTGDGGTLDVFVPGWLAADVAHLLAQDHRVVHGWLGVTGSGLTGSCGAEVQAVMPGAPADQALSPGDVVVAVDGRPVCDWAELQASLYVMQPDQAVDLEIESPGGTTTVAVALSGSPS